MRFEERISSNLYSMPKLNTDYVAVGKFIGIHGNQGWLKINVYSGIPDRFKNIRIVYFSTDYGYEGRFIADQKLTAQHILLKVDGVNNREDAHELINREIFVPEKEKIVLPENQYFIDDLIGLAVFDVEGNRLGVVKDILTMVVNDIYVVQGEHREILIPASAEFIKLVEIEEGRMTVRLWDGM
jgi:16S rRNA processing protein RimM